MNYSDLNREIDKTTLSSIQGQEYRKKYNCITKEGFSNLFGENTVDAKNKSDLNDLLELEKKYQELLAEYLNDYRQVMSNATQYFDVLKSPLINKNIRLTDGTIGYVTNAGIFKPYPSMDIFNNTSGKNGCPSNFTQVEAIVSDNKVTTTPPLTVGEKMELNQSCGNEGKNVFVSRLGQEKTPSYQGCFKTGEVSIFKTGERDVELGNWFPLEQTGSFEQCKQLAQVRGKKVFGLNSVNNKAMCYIGDDIEKIRSNGLSLKNIVSWETPINTSAVSAVFNKSGQLQVKGYVNAVSNIIPGLTFQVYKGYMNDNVNFFKTATKLGSRGVTTSSLNGIRSSTNSIINENSQKVSVEWIGYVQVPSYQFDSVRFELESDDCSFMWIGNEAISNYNINNAFIKNSGIHAMKKVSKSISLKSNTYYPIRIQYGNNEGKGNIKLWQYNTIGTSTRGGPLRGNTTPDPFSSQLILPNSSTISTLWQSNAPVSGCDPIYGGSINSSDSVATWGYNCNSMKNSKGAPYNVPIGNVTDKVKSVIEKKWSASYLVGGDGNDPAYGCRKNFSVNYKCGNGVTKSINRSGEAGGQTAVFNCRNESKKCSYFLRVQNDGNLVIYNLYDRSVLWNSNTSGKTGEINEDKKASKGKYRRNYLWQGETLNDGEFIGSDNGKCYLQMVKGVGLQLIYNELNCTSIEGKMYGNNDKTFAAYSTDNDRSNLFKTGYISNESVLKPYNQSQLSQTNNYIEIGLGNKNIVYFGGKNVIKVNNIEECKPLCNEDKNCDGFNYLNFTYTNDKTKSIGNEKTCILKDNSEMNQIGKDAIIYPNLEEIFGNGVSLLENKLYKRMNNVKNNSSCSKEVSPISNDLYSNYLKGGSFTEKDTCGLGKYNQELKKKLNHSLSRLQLTVKKMNEKLSKLSVTDKKILTEHGYNEKKINDNIMSIGLTHQKYLASKPQFETIKAMANDTEADMLSKSYNSLLWSILAIMIVIGGIKMTK